MKKTFIIANWKSYKTTQDASSWMKVFIELIKKEPIPAEKEIIICPPFTLLSYLKDVVNISITPITIGAQDISPFPEGKYTGAVNGAQLKEFASYVIIGHSERRESFKENDEILNQKVLQAKTNSLTPIFCVQSDTTVIPQGIDIVAYEPIAAIGTGSPDNPEDVARVASSIRSKQIKTILYGGSVTAANVSSFTRIENKQLIKGILVGTDSLNPEAFLGIVRNS